MNPISLLPFLAAQAENTTEGAAAETPPTTGDVASEATRALENLRTGQGSPVPFLSDQQWAEIQPHLIGFALNCIGALFILIVGWIVAKWLSSMARKLLQRQQHLDITVSLLLSRVVGWAVMILAVAGVAQLFGLGASMFAAVGAAGLAIGLALKDTMSNVASGVMLLVVRPFNVGDAVKLGGEVYIVDEIGLFTTRAHLPDGPNAMIPNTKIATSEIINYSVCHEDMRRLDLTVGIAYEDSIDAAFGVLNGVLDREERVLAEPERLIAVSEMADSSINILVRCWTKRADWWNAKLDLTREIKISLDQAGISIPFPQRDLHVVSGSLANGAEKDEADVLSEKFLPKQLPLEPAAETTPPAPEEPVTEATRWSRLRLPTSRN
ncbi:MAG: mechanosensitive ion channel domain-containing protein [Verrucomicrobiota bacterium]